MKLTEQQTRDFAKYARNPEIWRISARRHLAVAKVLKDRTAVLGLKLNHSADEFDEFSSCFYAWYLHAGLAIENAVKAVLILKDPSLVLEGKLDQGKLKRLCGKSGHGLLVPVRSVLGELSESEYHLLVKLEEHVIWAGKYTVPMFADDLYNEAKMNVLRTSPMDEFGLLKSVVGRLFDLVSSRPERFR